MSTTAALDAATALIAERQITIEEWLAAQPATARGETAENADIPRLNEQGLRVYRVMRDLLPHTLRDISAKTGDPEASVSARIREIRRYLSKDGKGTVFRERVAAGNGLHTYTMRLQRYFGGA